MRRLAFALALSLFAAPAFAQESLSKLTGEARFRCYDGGPRFAAYYQERPSKVMLVFGDGTTRILDIKPAGSGYHYADAQTELRGKGAWATFKDARGQEWECVDVLRFTPKPS